MFIQSETQIEVRYYETDQMGIVHHSNYIRYFECEARNHDAGGVGRSALPHPGPDGRHPPGGLQGGEGADGADRGADGHLQSEGRAGL